ncbi:MAG: hypothetical protein H0T73_19990 [Ardenticatenales bacterium]|nr:hypothetical protein [Ardenticatenales bacterium]
MNNLHSKPTTYLLILLFLLGLLIAPTPAVLADEPSAGAGTETGYDWSDHADACARGYSWSNGRPCP